MAEEKRFELVRKYNGRALFEERPYDKCPHCEEFKFRCVVGKELTYNSLFDKLFRRISGGEWVEVDRVRACKNCGYKEDDK